jgi:type II secretory pathway pseudopilin PulG
MKTPVAAGFTIIETLLVLAVTGALLTAIFATVGVSLNHQRYRDAAENLKLVMQSQYEDLNSVTNDRTNTWSCNESARLSEDTVEIRGQSDCTLVGKLVTIDDERLRIYTILAHERASATPIANDITSLRNNYALSVSTIGNENRELEWGTNIAWPRVSEGTTRGSSLTPRFVAFLFVKSPDTGQIYTFSSDDNTLLSPSSSDIRSMLVAGTGQRERVVCLDPNGIAPPDKLAVVVARYAAVPNAIELRSNELLRAEDTEC